MLDARILYTYDHRPDKINNCAVKQKGWDCGSCCFGPDLAGIPADSPPQNLANQLSGTRPYPRLATSALVNGDWRGHLRNSGDCLRAHCALAVATRGQQWGWLWTLELFVTGVAGRAGSQRIARRGGVWAGLSVAGA